MKKKPIAVYIRVSTGGQAVASQVPDLKSWLAAHGKSRRVVWYRDTFTGATLKRPGTKRLEADVSAGRVGTLVDWHLDRLGRTVRELLNFLHTLDIAGVEFVSVRDGVDASSAEGRLFRTMLAGFAEYEREVISQRIRAGVVRAKKEGKRWGGKKAGTRSKLSREKLQAVKRLLAAGTKKAAVTRQLGLSERSVYRAEKLVGGGAPVMPAVPPIEAANLRAICDVLADTNGGLTGTEIGRLLGEAGIADPMPTITKRYRLFEALNQRQASDRCANNVLAFVKSAMNPVRYVGNSKGYEGRRNELNRCLAFCGLQMRADGTLGQVDRARTLSEADERASRLRAALLGRKVHHDVLKFCRSELLQDNYFHAVFEAAKSVAEKIRDKTGLRSDGAPVVDEACGLGTSGIPLLAFNTLRSETERSEHTGLMNLMKGLFGTFRNTLAHAPKITWPIDEQDALDILSLCSLLHRRLDKAVRTR